MPPEKITTRGKILEKIDKNWNGLAIKDFKKDKNFKISERTLREILDDLVKEGRVSKETQKRTQDRRTNIIYKSIA
ncbi:MAG: hypothetical protein Q8M92_09320 [Candidatus Subteraquimicrobiales bacterium]|nr:hypothetical protein [Candidatus Subteraquimicrobiales bacterium]